VTPAIHSARLSKKIGYWVPAWLAAPGTTLMVETERGTRTATVVPMPLVDREKQSPYREVSHGR